MYTKNREQPPDYRSIESFLSPYQAYAPRPIVQPKPVLFTSCRGPSTSAPHVIDLPFFFLHERFDIITKAIE